MRTRNRRAAPWLGRVSAPTVASHVPQNDWQFSRIFEPVTQGRGHRS